MSEPFEPHERLLVRLGRRSGKLGSSEVWELRYRGRLLTVSRPELRRGLAAGWLTGIESVRRQDGDWGPLFGRPIYREVFAGTEEPRDHAKARAAERARRFERQGRLCLGGAALSFLVSLPALTGGVLTQAFLLLTLCLGIGAGLQRLFAAIQWRELELLGEKLVPPVLPPPAPVDWAQQAAEDEVEALSRPTSPRSPEAGPPAP